MKFLTDLLKGILIGVGSIAPGVSGGALAMIFGLYEDMVKAVGNFFKDIKKNIFFLLPIGIGVGIGVIGFSNVLKYLLNNYPMPTTFTFAGLIIGTLPVLFKRANKKGFKEIFLLPFILTFAVAVSFVFLETGFDNIEARVDIAMTAGNLLRLAACGFLIAGSLVIPGVSGSVLLMLIGVYGTVLEAVSTLNLYILVPLAAGLGIGVLAFSKLMDYLLDRHYGITYYAVLGFVIGSIPEVITGFSLDLAGFLSVLCLVGGFAVSYCLSRLEKD